MELTKLFKVFADETRTEVVKHLSKGECCSCQFSDKFDVSQPTLAYHLKLIRESGLASTKKVGTWNKYLINNNSIDKMIEFLNELKQTNQIDCKCK